MPTIGKFEVQLEDSNKNVLPQYFDEDLDVAVSSNASPSIAVYVEVKPGQQFQVRQRVLEGYEFDGEVNSLNYNVYVDGKFAKGTICTQEQYGARGKWVAVADRTFLYEDDVWTKYSFHFGNLSPDTQASGETSSKQYANTGLIEIRIWRYHVERWVRPTKSNSEMERSSTVPEKSEKALKDRAITLTSKLGDGVPAGDIVDPVGVFPDINPVAKFYFHYRTREALQELGVVPKDKPTEELPAYSARELSSQSREGRQPGKRRWLPGCW